MHACVRLCMRACGVCVCVCVCVYVCVCVCVLEERFVVMSQWTGAEQKRKMLYFALLLWACKMTGSVTKHNSLIKIKNARWLLSP